MTRVSADLFELLRVRPTLGRAFLPEEDQYGGRKVVILSHALWQRRFGANPEVLGQTLTLNDQSYLVVGVMPPDFSFPRTTTEMWTPIAFSPGERGTREHELHLRARAAEARRTFRAWRRCALIEGCFCSSQRFHS